MSRALDLAKECGLNVEKLGAIAWTTGYYGVTRADLETFYRRAQAEVLRSAAEKLQPTDYFAFVELNKMAERRLADKEE